MACRALDDRRVSEGGRWSTGERRGRYRLVMTEESGDGGGRETRHHVYVLWIAETAAGEPLGAIETARLPLDENVRWLEGIEVLERDRRSYANVRGYRRGGRTELTFELGPPGQVTRVGGT